MKKNAKRFLSMLLALSMVFGLLVFPAAATETEEPASPAETAADAALTVQTTEEAEPVSQKSEAEKPAVTVEDSSFTYTLRADAIDVSDVSATSVVVPEDAEIDEDNREIIAVGDELKNITVVNEDGESVALTEEQIQTILYLYGQYQDVMKENANIYGVQTPFFLEFNDDAEDGLGILGEMLVLAGASVDDVRSGNYSYDDLIGMIQNFIYTYDLGAKYYSSAILNAQKEALQAVEDSGAKNEAQKLLALNNWLAQNCTFDMPYIMNSDSDGSGTIEDDEKIMEAPNGSPKNEHYDEVYNIVYEDYLDSIEQSFHDQIYNAVVADLRQQYYENAIRSIVYQNAYDQGLAEAAESDEVQAAAEQKYIDDNFQNAYEEERDRVYEEVYAEKYKEYVNDGKTEDEADALAKADAEQAVIDQDEEIQAAARETVEANYNELSEEEKQELAKEFVKADEDANAKIEEAANKAADDFMTENADAIEEDAPGFVEATFGEEAAAQLAAGCDDFIADAEENGVEVDPVNAPGYKMTVEEITQNTMENEKIVDLDGDGENDTTANDAIPIYAQAAAESMTPAVINGWKGCHIGALGFGTAVCLGYTKAYTYLVQCMHPEIYGTSSNADMTKSANWKTADDLYVYDENDKLDLDSGYVVDTVRVTFDTEISMFGPDNTSNFGEVHFWNAVKVNNKWYYADPCYTDVYVEVMSRDRVETDGNMNHLYFLFSHTSAASMYDGYTNTSFGSDGSGITSLYTDVATNKDYEDSWISRINCNPSFSDGYVYYIYDSTDLLTILEESETSYEFDEETLYKLVRHKMTDTDKADSGDDDYETLIAFNVENDDGEIEARVYDPDAQETVKNDLLTELVNRHFDYAGVYPSVEITCALYNGKVYFNLANCLLSIDVETYEVALVKEYNTVSGVRDNDVDFGGMAFSVTTEDKADFTVQNHPIAAISLKDGELTVSIATNFALISGKKVRTNPAIEVNGEANGYGYEYEESNFNPNYSTYFNSDDAAQYGVEEEVNDNDEFMWSANFVEKLDMSHLTGSSHQYEEVTVEPFCGMDGFTEKRCTTCGASEPDSRVTDEGTALEEHHFVEFNETYYTKDDGGSWNKGTSYVCAVCSYAVDKPTDPGSYADEEDQAEYERKMAEYEAAAESAGHTYVPTDAKWSDDSTSVTFKELECSSVCSDRQPYLDALLEDDTIAVTLKESVTAQAALDSYEGDCTEGAIAVYVATGEAEGYAYTATNKVQLDPGQHAYEAEFTWTEGEDGKLSATANLTCGICGDHHEDVEAVVTLDEDQSVAATCSAGGKEVYVATATVTDEDGKEIGSATDTKEVTLKKLAHTYDEDGICTVCGAYHVHRISGETRYETAYATADELKEALGVEKFDTIVVASGTDFPDALAGSYLATEKNAPILLTQEKRDSEVVSYIKENLSADGQVYILGGTVAVSQAFEDGLKEAGVSYERLAGDTRYQTDLEILEEAGLNGKEILVCTGNDFADSLAASATNLPILLVNNIKGELTEDQIAYLESLKDEGITFYIIGGTAAVSADLEAMLKEYGTVERVSGDTREETSVKVAEKFFDDPYCAALAYSRNFPDGLCGGALAYNQNGPILLVNADKESYAAGYVEDNGVDRGIVFGGTAALSDDSVRVVFDLSEDEPIH